MPRWNTRSVLTISVALASAVAVALGVALASTMRRAKWVLLGGICGLLLAAAMAAVGEVRWHDCDARNTRATNYGYENYYPGVGHGRFYREGCPRRVLGLHDPFGRKDRVSPY